jgi:hypothetical protein
VPEEDLNRELARKRTDAQGAAQVLLAKGVWLLGRGDADGAAAAMEEAIAVSGKAGIRNAYTLPPLCWLATARRLQAEKAADYTPHRRRSLLRRAAAAARRAIRASRLCQNDLPQALREYALILAMSLALRLHNHAFDPNKDTKPLTPEKFQEKLTPLLN